MVITSLPSLGQGETEVFFLDFKAKLHREKIVIKLINVCCSVASKNDKQLTEKLVYM